MAVLFLGLCTVYCFSQRLNQMTFPVTVGEGSFLSTALPILAVCRLFDMFILVFDVSMVILNRRQAGLWSSWQ